MVGGMGLGYWLVGLAPWRLFFSFIVSPVVWPTYALAGCVMLFLWMSTLHIYFANCLTWGTPNPSPSPLPVPHHHLTFVVFVDPTSHVLFFGFHCFEQEPDFDISIWSAE